MDLNSKRWIAFDVLVGSDGVIWINLYWETGVDGRDLRLVPVVMVWDRTWQEYGYPGYPTQPPVTAEMRHLITGRMSNSPYCLSLVVDYPQFVEN